MPIGGAGGSGSIGNSAANSAALSGSQVGSGNRAARGLGRLKAGISRFMSRIGGTRCHDVPGPDPMAQTQATIQNINNREAWLMQLQMNEMVRQKKLGATDVETAERATAGGVATVNAEIMQRVEFNKNIGNSNTRRGFFKGNAGFIPYNAYDAGMAGHNTDETGSVTEDVREGWALQIRAVASSMVDELLGTNLLADSVLTTLNGVDGYTCALANGVQYRVDRKNPEGATVSTFADVNLASSVTQQGLANLQVLDWITGQIDRHPGNLFIDPVTGKVTGIDNDLAFGTNLTLRGYNIGAQLGLPTRIDAEMAARIRNLDVNRLKAGLLGVVQGPDKLNDAEVASVLERIEQLKAHIDQLERDGKLVREWNNTTYQTMSLGMTEAQTLSEIDRKGGRSKSNIHDLVAFLEFERQANIIGAREEAAKAAERAAKAAAKAAKKATGEGS